ncbi:MAG: SDR family NAD(P)-dependent oxidoreductase [Brachybacterium sp.]|nr:SDR family NAD(P)-dependent oxidoreductase [Brachybacterium sp.]
MHTALITGGTSGIGAAFARAFARRGMDLVLVARDADRLAETSRDLTAEHGVHVETIRADLASREDQQRVADRIESVAPGDRPIDILVNNAGFSLRASLVDADGVEAHDRGYEVMVRSIIVLCGAAARAMGPRGGGWIINVGSTSAFVPQNNYSAIKAWVNAYTEALAVALRPSGVQVALLAPGWVRTEFHSRAGIKGSSIPGFLWLTADRLVEDCLRDVARGRVVSVPSRRFQLIVAALRIIPRRLIHRISAIISDRRNRER